MANSVRTSEAVKLLHFTKRAKKDISHSVLGNTEPTDGIRPVPSESSAMSEVESKTKASTRKRKREAEAEDYVNIHSNKVCSYRIGRW